MAKCKICKKESRLISAFLGLCVSCIREDFAAAFLHIQKAHAQARETFNLPYPFPHETKGKKCPFCVNACQVGSEGVGYCGLPLDSRKEASLSWYYDPLPTNCVADWVCGGSCDIGYKNLAVFYNACSFDCLFCQNWHFREANLTRKISAEELADKVDHQTACICFFGGDPTPQLPHSILVSHISRSLNQGRALRFCWETNGSMASHYLQEILEISLESGGCIKFDLKTWTEELNLALCGTTNRQTLDNFRLAANYIQRRPEPPLVVASTLLVPGYIDIYEIENIAHFIAELNPLIPYSLLAFQPDFLMNDLPPTSSSHAQKAKEIALDCGLKNVRIGNIHLLSNDYTIE